MPTDWVWLTWVTSHEGFDGDLHRRERSAGIKSSVLFSLVLLDGAYGASVVLYFWIWYGVSSVLKVERIDTSQTYAIMPYYWTSLYIESFCWRMALLLLTGCLYGWMHAFSLLLAGSIYSWMNVLRFQEDNECMCWGGFAKEGWTRCGWMVLYTHFREAQCWLLLQL